MLPKLVRAASAILLVVCLFFLVIILEVRSRPAYDPSLHIAFVGTQNDADCIVLWQKEFAMMVDTGEAIDKEAILQFLAQQGIEKLDYLVLTHPDKDHIGCAAAIVNEMPVEALIEPYYQKPNADMEWILTRAGQNQTKVVIPTRVLHYTINDMQIYIYPPNERKYAEDNNYSLGILVKHRDVNLFLPGDALDKRLAELNELELPPIHLYKLPHHGRYSGYSQAMLERLQPLYAVATAEIAAPELLLQCEKMGTQLLFSVQNTLHFESDGSHIELAEEAAATSAAAA